MRGCLVSRLGWLWCDSRVMESNQSGHYWIPETRALPKWLFQSWDGNALRLIMWPRNILSLLWWPTNRYSLSVIFNVSTPLSQGLERPCPLALWHLGVRDRSYQTLRPYTGWEPEENGFGIEDIFANISISLTSEWTG